MSDIEIKINNGQGITQAIKKQIENENGSIINNNLSVWQKVMECVKGDEKGKECYSGNDNTEQLNNKNNWKNNFIVKTGDILKLTQTTWNKIVELLTGKTTSNHSETKPQEESTKTPEEKTTMPESQPEIEQKEQKAETQPEIEQKVQKAETPSKEEVEVAVEEVAVEEENTSEVEDKTLLTKEQFLGNEKGLGFRLNKINNLTKKQKEIILQKGEELFDKLDANKNEKLQESEINENASDLSKFYEYANQVIKKEMSVKKFNEKFDEEILNKTSITTNDNKEEPIVKNTGDNQETQEEVTEVTTTVVTDNGTSTDSQNLSTDEVSQEVVGEKSSLDNTTGGIVAVKDKDGNSYSINFNEKTITKYDSNNNLLERREMTNDEKNMSSENLINKLSNESTSIKDHKKASQISDENFTIEDNIEKSKPENNTTTWEPVQDENKNILTFVNKSAKYQLENGQYEVRGYRSHELSNAMTMAEYSMRLLSRQKATYLEYKKLPEENLTKEQNELIKSFESKLNLMELEINDQGEFQNKKDSQYVE